VLDFITSLVIEGYLPVFTTLLEFLPHVVLLLAIVSLFHNSGFILGFGCTTLAIGAGERDKRLIRFLAFIPCSAKLPVLVFICSFILGWTIFGVAFLYLLSIFIGLILGGYKVIHCPRLKTVSVKNFLITVSKNIIEFLKRITVGLVIVVTVLFTLQYFSLLLPITAVLEPLFVPIGLGSAAVIACLVFGLVAKEMIIGTILTFGVAALGLTTASAISFLVFVLLYTPCVPALTAMKSKMGLRFTVQTALLNFAVAYGVAFVVYNVMVILILA